jgi:hypothetical protein
MHAVTTDVATQWRQLRRWFAARTRAPAGPSPTKLTEVHAGEASDLHRV